MRQLEDKDALVLEHSRSLANLKKKLSAEIVKTSAAKQTRGIPPLRYLLQQI